MRSSRSKAAFAIGIPVNRDQQGGRLFGRQAWAGLAGGWGTMVAGRVATFSSGTGSFDMFGAVDPFVTGFGDSSLGSTFNACRCSAAGQLRAVSVADLGWIQVRCRLFVQGYRGRKRAAAATTIRSLFTGASIFGGPVLCRADIRPNRPGCSSGYGLHSADRGRRSAGSKEFQLGATFDLKFVKLHGAYAKEDHVYYTTCGIAFMPRHRR